MQKKTNSIFNLALITITLTLYTSNSYSQPIGYELFWQDEFNGVELDTTKWEHRGLGSRRGGTVIKEATKVDGNGNLLITTTILDSNYYHVGMIGTGNTFNTTYGYFEARVKFGKRLNWDSFWLQSPTAYQAGPTKDTGAEIDICEYYGNVRRVATKWDDEGNAIYDTLGYEVSHNIHWADEEGIMNNWGSRSSLIQDPNDFVTLAVEWTQDRYYFYVNDSLTYDTRAGLSGIDEYIILSVEPRFWKDLPDSIQNGSTVHDTFFVDYVRVYKKNLTNVGENESFISDYSLSQNYPNPFNPTTIIKYSVPDFGSNAKYTYSNVTLKVYDLLGEEIAVLVNKEQKPGNYSVQFDASEISSGIYYYKLLTNNYSHTKKMIVLK
jgi:beta-glucanase (GH16 family)